MAYSGTGDRTMTYEHEHWGDRMQRQLDAEKAQKATADAARNNPRLRQLSATWAALKAAGKVSEAPASEPKQKPTPTAPGPKTRKAMQLAEALRRASRGDIGQALGAERVEVHKLPVHVVRG